MSGGFDLECDHCGDVAYTSYDIRDDGVYFEDGAGDQCASCGMPGWVDVDDSDAENVDVSWVVSDAEWARCKQADCESCASAAEGA